MNGMKEALSILFSKLVFRMKKNHNFWMKIFDDCSLLLFDI